MRITKEAVKPFIAANGKEGNIQYEGLYKFADGSFVATRPVENPGAGIETAKQLWVLSKPTP